LSAAIRLTAQPSEIAGFPQFQTPGGQTALAKPEPVTVSGEFKRRPQACAGRSPSGQAETVTF